MASPEQEEANPEIDLEMLTAEELQEMELDRLDEIFSKAQAPDPEQLRGTFRGLALASPVHDYVPKALRKVWALYASSPLFMWKGKEFEMDEEQNCLGGRNLFVSLNSPIKLFKFTTRTEPSEYDSGDCLVLDYDLDKNPLPIRKVRDELRRVNPNLYLGRGNLMIGEEPRFAFYFTLEPELSV
ncbi:MAG: hypothetical protein AB1742_06490 [bacterium]